MLVVYAGLDFPFYSDIIKYTSIAYSSISVTSSEYSFS